mgnify:CR=1 FL=1
MMLAMVDRLKLEERVVVGGERRYASLYTRHDGGGQAKPTNRALKRVRWPVALMAPRERKSKQAAERASGRARERETKKQRATVRERGRESRRRLQDEIAAERGEEVVEVERSWACREP